MPEAHGVEQVEVARTAARLEADRMCSPRFVRYAVAVPEHVVAYRLDASRGLPVGGTPVEAEAWEAAARTYLDEVSHALEGLYRAHGGRRVRVDLAADRRTWSDLSYPFAWPGWQRRWARRSKQAQREFVDRVDRAAQAYGPIRTEVARRYEAADAERRAERRALAEAAELRWQERMREEAPLRRIAARGMWILVGPLDWYSVYRLDVEPSPAARRWRERRGSEPVTAWTVEERATAHAFRSRSSIRIDWDPAACAAVEQECADAGRPVTFGRWWDTVTRYDWRTEVETGPHGLRVVTRFGHAPPLLTRSAIDGGLTGRDTVRADDAGPYIGRLLG